MLQCDIAASNAIVSVINFIVHLILISFTSHTPDTITSFLDTTSIHNTHCRTESCVQSDTHFIILRFTARSSLTDSNRLQIISPSQKLF